MIYCPVFIIKLLVPNLVKKKYGLVYFRNVLLKFLEVIVRLLVAIRLKLFKC